MKELPKLFAIILFLGIILINHQQPVLAMNVMEEKVDSVDVQLMIAGKIYEGLQERIEFSISRVGERILLSQPISLLKDNKETVKLAITNVFSKVLTGFKLDSIDLFIAKHTKLVIHLTPIPPLITAIDLNIMVRDLAPELQSFIQEASDEVEIELNRVFVGLPVASISWSEDIFNLVVNYLLERDFPGYNSRFTLKAGQKTEFDLNLVPQEPAVARVNVNYSSPNVPAWLVKFKAKKYQDKFYLLKGIPVDFLEHHRSRLERYLTRQLNDFPELQQWGMLTTIKIIPGVNTQVSLAVDSQYYQTKFEARYFSSREDYYSNFQAYLGYRIDDYELFFRKYWGINPSGQTKVGIRSIMAQNLSTGLEYELEHGYKDLWFHFQFERGDYLDFKLGLDKTPNEAVIGIYLNKNANLELVEYDNLFGMQLMFHF